jgi:type I restriction enzyme, S subunit
VSELKPYKLGDVVGFGNGKSRPSTQGSIPIYGGNGILGYCADSNYDGETIVIGRVGAYCGATYYENQPIWISDNALSAKPKGRNNTKFFYYFLKDMDLNQHAGGSSHPLVTQTLLNSLDVEIVECPDEQKAIASVLSGLDDKIDLLHRQNTTLERMAETLFRQWFVEEAQEDWEEKSLKEVVDIGIGRTPPRQEHQWFSESETDVKWISIKDLGNDGAYIFNTSEYLTKEAVQRFNIPVVPKDTVVLSFKMTLGRVAITTQDMLSNEAIAHFKFNSKTPFTKEYLFLFLKTFKWELLGSTSSIVTSINSAMIKDLEISIPDVASMSKFKEAVEPLFVKIKSNQQQIQTLEKLRDNLHPKLMSGEVRVS